MGHLFRAAVLITAALAITSAISTLLQTRAQREAHAAAGGLIPAPGSLKLPSKYAGASFVPMRSSRQRHEPPQREVDLSD